ncbi:MAG: hypothetical protein WCW26_00965 [Candidatus Buchananbacteria bacterium]
MVFGKNKNYNNQPPKKPFQIQDLNEDTRKLIFVISIIVLMIAIFGGWLITFKGIINSTLSEPQSAQWDSLKKDLADFSDSTKELLNQTQNTIKQITPTTTTPSTLTNEDIDKLKKKLAEKETASWPVYQNQEFKFEIKYLPTLTPKAPTEKDGKTVIVNFVTNPEDRSIKIKKYDLLSDFSSLAGVKKYWQKDDYFLVAFDFINNTSTELMFETFKFIE